MQKLYIVTGANGHLGNTIVRTLVKQNLSVRAFILANDKDKMLKTLGVDVFKGDVRNKDSIKPLFDLSHTNFMPEDVIVIHTAGIVAITSKISPLMEQVNVGGTMNLVDLALENQVHRFIYISSVHAIPELNHGKIISEVNTFDPDLVMGGYAKTKAIATQYVLDAIKKGLNGIIIHPSGIIGPNDYGLSHTTQMIEDYMNGKLTSRINGGYDFVDVRDVASGVIQSTISGEVGVCYILSGHYVTIKELFDQLKFFSGKKRAIHVLPMWFAKMTAPLAEFYYKLRKKPPIYTKYSLYTLECNANFSYEKAKRDLNYQPRVFSQTIDDTIQFLASHNRIRKGKVLSFVKRKKPSIE